VITVDDIIDSIRAEGTEDAQVMVGAGREELVFSSVADKLKGRIPWLVVNLITSAVGAMVVLQFEGLIAEIAILAVLMPVIANQSGNAGQQSLAVTLRGIVLDQVNSKVAGRLIVRESLVGLINGAIAGVLVGLLVTLLSMATGEGSWRLGAVIAASMTCSLTVGTFTGTGLPMLMRRLGADPATASTIFLTMVTDSLSFLIFLGMASALAA
jgi:magnesium transporter